MAFIIRTSRPPLPSLGYPCLIIKILNQSSFTTALLTHHTANMPELRKRKVAAITTPPLPPVKKANSVKSSTSDKKGGSSTNGSAATNIKVTAGDNIQLDGFGGEIETNDGEKVTLKKLVEESKSGAVLFTYPKASTPGCKCITLFFKSSSSVAFKHDLKGL